MTTSFTRLSADEAAALILHGQTIGFSGFTSAGAPKGIPEAIARRGKQEHAAGRPFQIGVATGASTGASLDGALADADAIAWRTPYQSNPTLRKKINEGKIDFFDINLSVVAQQARYGFLGQFDWAIVEACSLKTNGEVVLTSSVGASPTYLRLAKKVIIELNSYHPPSLFGIHDIYEPADPPNRRPIPLVHVEDRIGTPTLRVDPSKIVGIVETNRPDEILPFKSADDVARKIAENVAEFLVAERQAGRIPTAFLPIQAGVGNVSNAVLAALAEHPKIPAFKMFTEVMQDSAVELIKSERLRFVSTCSLTMTPPTMEEVYAELDFFRKKIILRPQEITNHPELVRRLGVLSLNTALEIDLFGNVNSTHIMGSQVVNGIGGSGDFTRNAYLSIFMCPSTAKGGTISAIVPHVSHVDHNEHSVHVFVTEQGVADLRAKSPSQRARLVIDRCAHPDFRDTLNAYLTNALKGHIPSNLNQAFAMHAQYLRCGSMHSIDWEQA